MKVVAISALMATLVIVPACTSQRDVECGGAALTGAVVGGLIGNQIGGGSGKDILTASGAAAGGLMANRAAGC
ncbi:MAG: glycine zipper 2TM domain-containing protein [Shimia sp.]|uniref:glycine zipper 2TM domain-containing protein n=1 Tax=Shimia sp. TaxID=1954381 RepID=UPI004057D6AA